MTYRQLNDWDARGAIPGGRAGDAGWRKFSARDLFAMMVCSEIRRRVGVPVESLRYVMNCMVQNDGRNHLSAAIKLMRLNKHGVTLRSVTEPISEDSMGRLMENVMAAVAQLDNDVRGDRTKAGMRAALESGRWTFGPPLGYVRSRDPSGHPTIAPDGERAPLLRKAFELCASGLHRPHQVLDVVTGLDGGDESEASPAGFEPTLPT